MKKTSFLTLEKAREIIQTIPTPFHIYQESGIRNNARALKAAFAWNPGFREYFAVKATPNPTFCRSSRRRAAAATAPAIQSFCWQKPLVPPVRTSCSLPM